VNHREQLAILSAGLRTARRRVYLHGLADGLRAGVGGAVRFVLIWSILVLAYITVKRGAGFGGGIERWSIEVAVVGAIVAILFGVLRSAMRLPGDSETAERLDLGLVNHNRIATAHDLLERGESRPMALAAIADGLEAVSNANGAPAVERTSLDMKKITRQCIGVAACWLVMFLMVDRGVIHSPLVSKPGELALSLPPIPPSASKPEPPKPPVKPTAVALTQGPSNPPGVSGPPAVSAVPTVTAQAASSSGASGGAGSGKATSGEPSSGAPTSKQNTPPTPGRSPDSAKPSKGSGMGGGVQGVATGSVGAGGKGSGGASLAIEKESRKMDALDLALDDEAMGDKAEADEQNENTHRGGAQPLLQDRLQAPTRELGIGGLMGSPGTGRGGPTPTKKARGAGSLFLGVPMPDYVPGKMLPGTSKIARENVKPRRSDIPSAAAADVAPRVSNESVIERYDVSPQDTDLMLRYFQALHEDEDSKGALTP